MSKNFNLLSIGVPLDTTTTFAELTTDADARYLKLSQTPGSEQTITGSTPKLDVLKSKTILGTDANGKIIEGTHQSLAGHVPYTGATGDVTLGTNLITAKTFVGDINKPYRSLLRKGNPSAGVAITNNVFDFTAGSHFIGFDDETQAVIPARSVSCWVWLVAPAGGSTSAYFWSSNYQTRNSLGFSGGGRLMYVTGATALTLQGDDIDYTGRWTHVVAITEGNDTNRVVWLYRDTNEFTRTSTGTGAQTLNKIGAFTGGTLPINGYVDNVVEFDRKLTPAEIKQIFDAGREAYCPITDYVNQYTGKDFAGTAAVPTAIYNMQQVTKDNLVPYTGATKAVNLGANNLTTTETIQGILTGLSGSNVALLNGSNQPFTGAVSILTSGSGTFNQYRDRTAAGVMAQMQLGGKDASGNLQAYASIGSHGTTTTNGAEVGDMAFSTVVGGSLTEKIRILGNGNVGIGTATPSEKLDVVGDVEVSADVHLFSDNGKVLFGAADDASILYDGTNLVINPKVVGTGYLQVSGQILATDKVLFTQTDGNECIDSLADGYMDYGATTAHRWLIGGTEQINLIDGALLPKTNNDIDLGSSTYKFKDVYIAGKLTVDGAIDPTYIEFTQIAKPSDPAATKNRLYFKSDDKLYKLNSAGTEAEVGGGGGVSDHSDLGELDYASAGHTGFEPAITAGTSAQFLKGDKSLDSSVYLTTGFVDRGDPSAADFTSFTTDNTFRDLDLSSIVPAGAIAVALRFAVYHATTSGTVFTFRKNGLTNAINTSLAVQQVTDRAVYHDGIVAVDSSRIIEYRGSNATMTSNVTVKGWWI